MQSDCGGVVPLRGSSCFLCLLLYIYCTSYIYSCLHMTRVGTIPVDLDIPDLNVEQRNMMGLKYRQ